MTTRLTVSSLALPQKISVNTTFSKPLDSAGPFFVQPGLTSKNVLATVNLKSIGDAAAAKTTLILPNASSDYTFKTASGAVTISSSTTNPTTQKITTTVIASLDLTTAANGYNTPSVQFTDLTAKFHYVAAIKKTATAPAVPAFIELTSLKLANDTGSNATDGVSFDGAINLVSRVGTTYSYSVDSGKTYQSVTGTSIDLLDKTYPAYSVKVIEKNAKGVIVNATTNANAIVVEEGAATPTITLATDTGSSLTDGITSIGTVNVTGLETGATWQYSINGLDFVNGKGTSFVLPPNLTYDTGDIQVRQIDKAGNESDSGTNTIAWTIDTVANQLVEVDINDTGIDGDYITALGKVTVNDLEEGATLWYNVNGSTVFTKAVGNTFIVPSGTYEAGKIQWKQIDAAGNESVVSPSSVKLFVQDAVSINAANNVAYDASKGNYSFTVDAGNYQYNIANFGTGDNIDFPVGNVLPSVINTSFTDNAVDLQYANDGKVTLIRLTGLTATEDAAIISINSIKNLFGSASVTSNASSTTTVTPTHQAITGIGSASASAGDVVFDFSTGSYSYSVSDFSKGDVLNFPIGNLPTVINTNFSDNKVDLQWADSGKVIVVSVTGLTSTQDASIISANSFKTLFGTDSISNNGAPVIAPNDGSTLTISGAGSSNAGAGNVKYSFAAGNYDYTIAGFGNGDVLDFPNDVPATVINNNFTDNSIEVQWASNGTVVHVILTGLGSDTAVGVNSFNSVFGPGSII